MIKYKEVNRLEEIKNHFWYDDEWRASITMLGGFHQGEPNREPNTEKDIRGPVSKDINFNPLDLVKAIRNKQENPDDIFHQMLLLSAETIGEIDRETRESERFKDRYKAIEKELWDEMIQLLREEQDELYKNVELAFGVCMVEDEGLLDVLIKILETSDRNNKKRSVKALGYVSFFSEKAANIIAEKALDKIIERLKNKDWEVRESAIEVLVQIASASPEAANILTDKALDKIIKMLKDEDRHFCYEALEFLGKIASASSEWANLIAEKALDKIIEMMKDEDVSTKAVKTLVKIASASPEASKIIAEKALDKIIERMKDEDKYVRASALETLGEIASTSLEAANIIVEKTLDKIIEMMKDEEWNVCSSAAKTFGRISASLPKKSNIISKRILLILKEKEWFYNRNTTHSLVLIAKESSKLSKIIVEQVTDQMNDYIGNFLKDKHYKFCDNFIYLLNEIVTFSPNVAMIIIRKSSKKLVKLLEYSYRTATIFRELAKCSSDAEMIIIEEIVDRIVELLKNEKIICPNSAINILEKISTPKLPKLSKIIIEKSISRIKKLLEDNKTHIRNETVKFLNEISKSLPEVANIIADYIFEQILTLLMDKDKFVRINTGEILVNIASSSHKTANIIAQKITEKLLELLNSKDISKLWCVIYIVRNIALVSPEVARSFAEKLGNKLVDIVLNKDFSEFNLFATIALINIRKSSLEASRFIDEKVGNKLIEIVLKEDRFPLSYLVKIALINTGKSSTEVARIIEEKNMEEIFELIQWKGKNLNLYANGAVEIRRFSKVSPEFAKFFAHHIIERLFELMNDKYRFVCLCALFAPIKIGKNSLIDSLIISKRAIERIMELLMNCEHSFCKNLASEFISLAKCSTELIIRFAEETFKFFKDWEYIRKNSAEILIKIAYSSLEAAIIISENNTEKIGELMENKDSNICEKAAYILDKLSIFSEKTAKIVIEKSALKIVELLINKQNYLNERVLTFIKKIFVNSKTRIIKAQSTLKLSFFMNKKILKSLQVNDKQYYLVSNTASTIETSVNVLNQTHQKFPGSFQVIRNSNKGQQ